MKIAELNPVHGRAFASGRTVRAGAWSATDIVLEDALVQRVIRHYGTVMGVFEGDLDSGGWSFVPESVGYGSVSDQGGMNKVMRSFGWYYRRAGGARYESIDGYSVR